MNDQGLFDEHSDGVLRIGATGDLQIPGTERQDMVDFDVDTCQLRLVKV